LPHYDADFNAAVMEKCNALLETFMAENGDELFSEPLDFLHERLDSGDPSRIEDGKFVRPFLTNKRYKNLVVAMIDAEGENMPQGLADLYMNVWVAPEKVQSVVEVESISELEIDEIPQVDEGDVIVEEEGLNVVVDDDGVVVVEGEEEEGEGEKEVVDGEALEEDELVADEFDIDTHSEPKKFRLEVMLPIILAAAIILLAIIVLLLYHFVYKKRKAYPSYKLIDATDLMVDADSVSSYETF